MPNGIIVTRDRFFKFIAKYESDVKVSLRIKIDRPITSYSDGDKVLCWYNDLSCGNDPDPDNRGRDHYITSEMANFRTRQEKWEELKNNAIALFPMEMTAIIRFQDALLIVKDSPDALTYINGFKGIVRKTYEELFHKEVTISQSAIAVSTRKSVSANKKRKGKQETSKKPKKKPAKKR